MHTHRRRVGHRQRHHRAIQEIEPQELLTTGTTAVRVADHQQQQLDADQDCETGKPPLGHEAEDQAHRPYATVRYLDAGRTTSCPQAPAAYHEFDLNNPSHLFAI